MLWALEYVKGSIFKFTYDAGIQMWTDVGRVNLVLKFSQHDTIFVCDDADNTPSLHIYTCSFTSGKVYKFNKTGEVLDKYDSEIITFGRYRVSGVDRIGNILITDSKNVCMKV